MIQLTPQMAQVVFNLMHEAGCRWILNADEYDALAYLQGQLYPRRLLECQHWSHERQGGCTSPACKTGEPNK